MAKLLKHLGIGNKKASSASPRIECDRIRQSPNNDSPVVSPYKPQSFQQCASSPKQPATDTSIASTVSSTSSGGNAAVADDFPCPPSSWFNSAECSSANDDFKSAPNIHPGFANKTEGQIRTTNIYENEDVSHNIKSNALFQEQSWEDIKKWLIEMTNPVRSTPAKPSTPVSTDYQVSQRDKENAAFLSEILTALQYARSEVLKTSYYNKNNAKDLKDINHYINASSAHQQQSSTDPIKIGGILNEVAMKLESQYESARMSFGSKDYERYTQLKLLLQSELQEPVYGIKKQEDNFKDTFNCSYSNSDNEGDENFPQNHIISLKVSPQSEITPQMRSSGFYEDAWDKEQAAEALQDQFNDEDGRNSINNSDHGDKNDEGDKGKKDDDEGSKEGSNKRCDVTKNEEIDMRTREGYDVPWDWQPHKKDARCQEGYEKPWDLKPQDKDDRGSKDYEDPWDKNNVHADLFVAKLAKDVKSTGNMRQAKRRGKEYEEPWDRNEMDMEVVTAKLAKETLVNKAANLSNNGSMENDKKSDHDKHADDRCYVNDKCPGSESVAKMAFKQPSPLNKPMQPLPPIPSSLHEQPWYHGEISRSSAEEVLKRAKVASYLVRKATKAPNEYSLSVKNTNGFVHLKITTDPNHHFILGLFSQPFSSIPLMVQYYRNNKLPIKGADHISLLHPLHKLS